MTQPIRGMIDFPANGGSVPGYLARPDGSTPGVVVLQEWWGLDDHIKSVADRFADAGFAALVPDLYRGHKTTEPDEARKLAMTHQFPQVRTDIQGAVDYLKAQPFLAPQKVGVIGFCMGGRMVGQMAIHGAHIDAVVAFYGVPALTDEDAAKISAPVLAIYGGRDQGFPPDVIAANDRKLSSAGVPHEIVVYPDAPHAFFNDTRPHIYDAAAAEDAWTRALDWFHRYLV